MAGMPFRSLATLQAWLTEFEDLGYDVAGAVKVIEQDGDGGANTGLVTVHLASAPTVVSIHPEPTDERRWVVSLEPREDLVTIDAGSLLELTAELSVVAELCAFLQVKSSVFEGQDTP
jgi:hypothetical protein